MYRFGFIPYIVPTNTGMMYAFFIDDSHVDVIHVYLNRKGQLEELIHTTN